MKTYRCLLWLAPLVLVVAVGCEKAPSDGAATQNQSDVVEQPAADAEVVLCLDCGEVKGSANCCAIDAARCDKCGLIKGSPGCCTIEKS